MYIYKCIFIYTYTYIYIYTYIYMYTHAHTCTHTHTHSISLPLTHTHAHTSVFVYMYIYIYIYKFIYTHSRWTTCGHYVTGHNARANESRHIWTRKRHQNRIRECIPVPFFVHALFVCSCMRGMTRLYVTWLIHTWHHSFICNTALEWGSITTRDMTYDSFIEAAIHLFRVYKRHIRCAAADFVRGRCIASASPSAIV